MIDYMNRHKIYPAGDYPTTGRVDKRPGFDEARPGSGPTPREEAAARQHYLDGYRDGYNRGITCREKAPRPLPGGRQSGDKTTVHVLILEVRG